MNYKETLVYMFQLLPMFQREGKAAFKKDLKNIFRLLNEIGNPQDKFKSIHIAGTNGKGTVSHMLAGIFQSAGYKTGLYTSPHYSDFRERIKINGNYISKRDVVNFVKDLQPAILKIRPSFFEVTVAMAFQNFAQHQVDIAIIETGLGGRLDSTNVIRPKMSVITNISFDHTSFLGDTLEKIAFEKAGIIKEGMPVLIGEYQEVIDAVFREKAREQHSVLYYAKDIVHVELIEKNTSTPSIRITDIKKKKNIIIDKFLPGPFQKLNIRSSLAAIVVWNHHYPKETVEWPQVKYGMEHLEKLTRYKGRWQILSSEPMIVADSAHNMAGLRIVLEEIGKIDANRKHFVIGFVGDKDWKFLLTLFPKEAEYYFAKPDIPRGLEVSELAEYADELGLQGKIYKSVRYALMAAKRKAGKSDLVFVGGSSFVVAEVV